MTLIFYIFRESKIKLISCYIIYSLLPILSALSFGPNFKEAIFLWDYQSMKWILYIFHLFHLIVIILLKNYLGVM